MKRVQGTFVSSPTPKEHGWGCAEGAGQVSDPAQKRGHGAGAAPTLEGQADGS